jgi:hypothetical protein
MTDENLIRSTDLFLDANDMIMAAIKIAVESREAATPGEFKAALENIVKALGAKSMDEAVQVFNP